MSRIKNVSTAIFVVDDIEGSRTGAASADLLFENEIAWTVLAVVAEHPRATSGATGFAGPVLSLEEMDERAASDLVAGDAATAETARAFGRRPVTHAVVRGQPAGAVSRYAAEHPTDLIVTSSPGLVESLTSTAVDPVLFVPPKRPEPVRGPVLLAVDDSPLDDAVISTGARLFDPSTTDHLVIHVGASRAVAQAAPVAHLMPGAAGAAMIAQLVDDLDMAADDAERVARSAVTDSEIGDVETIGEAGDPVTGILVAAAEHHASIIVVGAHDRGWLSRLLRPSVTDSLLHQSSYPILVTSGVSNGSGVTHPSSA